MLRTETKIIVGCERILKLMIDLDVEDDCRETFERLWRIYTRLVGNDDALRRLFPN